MSDTQDQGAQDSLRDAGRIIERFGGIRPMATKMEIPVTTVQGWKKRDIIPGNRRDDVLRAASSNNIDLSDILGKGAANQNAGVGFDAALNDAAKRPPVPPEEMSAADHDALLVRIRAAELRAVRKSMLITVTLLALGGTFGAFLLWPRQAALTDPRLGALEKRVGAVETEQSSLKNMLPDGLHEKLDSIQASLSSVVKTADDAAGGASISDRVAKLEEQVGGMAAASGLESVADKIAALEQSDSGRQVLEAAAGALNGAVMAPGSNDGSVQAAAQQNASLGQVLQGVPPADMKAAALLLGLAQMRESMGRSEPFAQDLASLQKMLGDSDPALNEAITRLAPQAEKGVLTPQGLSEQLTGLAGDIVLASLQGKDVSVADKAKARLNNIMEVRKDGALVSGTDVQGKIDQAQQLLMKGDVPGAMAIMKTLPAGAQAAAAPFMNSANVTVLAWQVQDMLSRGVLGQVSQSPGGLAYTARGGGLENLVQQVQTAGAVRGMTTTSSGFSILKPDVTFKMPPLAAPVSGAVK